MRINNILKWMHKMVNNKLISQSDFARLVGVSRQYISQMVADGKLPMQNGQIIKFKALTAYNKLKMNAMRQEITYEERMLNILMHLNSEMNEIQSYIQSLQQDLQNRINYTER